MVARAEESLDVTQVEVGIKSLGFRASACCVAILNWFGGQFMANAVVVLGER
jgi:hypothetical protein